MSSIYGNNIKVSLFGESHGKSIGVTIDNLPPGKKIDIDKINIQMKRRAPGQNPFSSNRPEKDQPNIISGFLDGHTTGTPLCAIIENNHPKSSDYTETRSIIRPSHADYTGNIRYMGYEDIRGGGHFSGRLTAPLTFAGSVCRQILEQKNIKICAHIYSIGSVYDDRFSDIKEIDEKTYYSLISNDFSVISKSAKQKMKEEILTAKNEGDSIGGIIECAVYGLDPGLGSPIFNGIESVISSMIFSIPSVKGIEFGEGFALSKIKGSIANDPFYIQDNKIKTQTNNNGGILGGISTGMPVMFKAVIKPTPSILKPQNTVNIKTQENIILEIKGQHDPCIVPRAVPVIESACAISILDLLVGENKL